MATSSQIASSSAPVTSAEWKMLSKSEVIHVLRRELASVLHAHSCRRRDAFRLLQLHEPSPSRYRSSSMQDKMKTVGDIDLNDTSTKVAIDESSATCSLSICIETKNMLQHMTACSMGVNCEVPRCALLRYAICHWTSCIADDCTICLPLKNGNFPSVLADSDDNSGVCSDLTSPATAYTPLCRSPLATKSTQMAAAFVDSSFNEVSSTVGNESESQLLGRKLLLPEENPPVTWRQTVGRESRDRFIQRIVEVLSQNVKNQSTSFELNGKTDFLRGIAKKLESEFFDTAVSRHDYHCMIAEKIAQFVRGNNKIQMDYGQTRQTAIKADSLVSAAAANVAVPAADGGEMLSASVIPTSDKVFQFGHDQKTSNTNAAGSMKIDRFSSTSVEALPRLKNKNKRQSLTDSDPHISCNRPEKIASAASTLNLKSSLKPNQDINAIGNVIDLTSDDESTSMLQPAKKLKQATSHRADDNRSSSMVVESTFTGHLLPPTVVWPWSNHWGVGIETLQTAPPIAQNVFSIPVVPVAEGIPTTPTVPIASSVLKTPTVCVDYLLRRHNENDCPRGPSCDRYHSVHGQPYQWQWQLHATGGNATVGSTFTANVPFGGDMWFDFGRNANFEIERTFCDESKCECHVTDDDATDLSKFGVPQKPAQFTLDFNQMTFKETGPVVPWTIGKLGTIRRLQVAADDVHGSHIVANGSNSNREQYLTVWQWFWFDDYAWIAYESKLLLQAASSDSRTSIGINPFQMQHQQLSLTSGYIYSEVIEEAYSKSPFGWFEFNCMPPFEKVSYIIDFNQFVQINRSTGRRRNIRRRPAWQLPGRPMTPIDSVVSTIVRFPVTWDMSRVNDGSRYHLITILPFGPTAAEYEEVTKLFSQTMLALPRIKAIRRIQNRSLWEKYAQFKMDAERTRRQPMAVRRLFHGTKKKFVEAICANGFDWRLCGTSSGTAFGKGSYFARDASYSLSYSDCNKMFLVQVAVGDYTLGNSGVVIPPPKDPKRPYDELYDTCVDNVHNPTIFVTFDRAQSYPEYIIEY